MQNLVVTDGDGGTTTSSPAAAAWRRSKALQAEGKLPGDYAVPCQVAASEHALEMSLAENTVRLAMHPADEFEAFAKLIDGGQTPEQIAERFGMTARHVEQRLKLGNAAPKLLKEYRAGELTLECLMAFTITDDRKRQMKVYHSLKDWQTVNPAPSGPPSPRRWSRPDSKLARFVGLDAYHAAGGTTQSDLFGDEVYLENPAAAERPGRRQAGRHPAGAGGRRLGLGRDQPRARLGGHPPLRPDSPAAGGRAAGAARTQRQAVEPSWKTSHEALEDTESDALDRRSRTRRKPGSPRSRKSSTPSPPTTRSSRDRRLLRLDRP